MLPHFSVHLDRSEIGKRRFMHQFARAIQDAAFQVYDLGRPSRSNRQATLVLFFILNDKLTD
jgi:hypothetical protein